GSKTVLSDALRRTAQCLTESAAAAVVVPQTTKHDTLSRRHTGHRATFHHLSGMPGQTCGEAMHERHCSVQSRVATATGKHKIDAFGKCHLQRFGTHHPNDPRTAPDPVFVQVWCGIKRLDTALPKL